jgi:hypothetical protein
MTGDSLHISLQLTAAQTLPTDKQQCYIINIKHMCQLGWQGVFARVKTATFDDNGSMLTT